MTKKPRPLHLGTATIRLLSSELARVTGGEIIKATQTCASFCHSCEPTSTSRYC